MEKKSKLLRNKVSSYPFGIYLLALSGQVVMADTITIGKGSGIVWEGMPYSGTLQVTTSDYPAGLDVLKSILITPTDLSIFSCVPDSSLTTIAGYKSFKIAPGIGIIPRATVTTNYMLENDTPETLTGNIGLPSTQATTSSGTVITNPLQGMAWCLAPRMISNPNFYKAGSYINATVTGTWVMVADGTQTSHDNIHLSNVNFAIGAIDDYQIINIFMRDFGIRVASLKCTVSTPNQIDFGSVTINQQEGAILSTKTNSLIAQCSQDDADRMTANINVQFRALTGLYESSPSRLSLSQGGGYITGEIDNGVTSSGDCNSTSGIHFDDTPIKIGSIANKQTSQIITNKVTWRLCSGGSLLPTGAVNAAAEMLVTFN